MNTPDFPPREPSPGHAQSAEFRERQWESQQRGMRVPALMLLVVTVGLLVLGSRGLPVIAAVLASVLGIWLMIGRGYVLVRCGVTLLAAWGLGRGLALGSFDAVLLACAALSAGGTCVAGLIVSRVCRAPSRWAQFSIWDLGSYMLAIAIGAALVRDDVAHLSLPTRLAWEGTLAIVALSGNTVLAGLPVLVPKRYREGDLVLVSAGLVLLVMPLLECAFLHAFRFVQQPFNLVGLPIAHWIGAVLVWTLLFTLETAGAFRDDVGPRPTAAAGEETLEGVE